MKYLQKLRKKFKALLILIFPLIVSSFFTDNANAQNEQELKKMNYIDKELEKVIQDKKAVGMIAAVISSDGVIEIGSAGVRKAGTNADMTVKDLVHIGSCTKAMTATMIATLVKEGRLSWDMKLTEAIPELKEIIHAGYKNITLWHLLTHRAGLPKNPVDESAYTDLEIKERRLSIVKDNIIFAPTYTIGEWNYSNFGYIIAACMAEQVTGLSWETLMKERLFDPLGMTTAGFGDPLKNNSTDQPWGHKISWIGNNWKPSRAYYNEAINPAGRVHCSVDDWAKFISLQLPKKNSFLDRSILNKLIEPTGFYAAGWGVLQEADQPWAKGVVLTHNGSNEIWYATVTIAPNLDRAYLIATNSCEFGATQSICNEILKVLIRKEMN